MAEISYCAAFIRESATDCSIAMARRVLTIVEPVPGTKEVDANMVELRPAMERTREAMLGKTVSKTLAIMYCVAQVPGKPPHQADRGFVLGVDHDHVRGNEDAIAEMRGMPPQNIRKGFGNAFARGIWGQDQGVSFRRVYSKASEMNKAHLTETCKFEFGELMNDVIMNAMEDPTLLLMFPKGSKCEKVEDSTPWSKKVSQHSLLSFSAYANFPLITARSTCSSDFYLLNCVFVFSREVIRRLLFGMCKSACRIRQGCSLSTLPITLVSSARKIISTLPNLAQTS